MCGLAGAVVMSGNTPTLSIIERERVFDLFIVSQLRGLHSAGAFLITRESANGRGLIVKKQAVPASQFLENGEGSKLFSRSDIMIFAGHCRHATKGNIVDDNAHPFNINNELVGMHNGTIEGLGGGGKTDSEELFESINEFGLKPTLSMLPSSGAFALAYTDLKDRTFNLVRNDKRPLYYMVFNQVFYYASEYAFLDLVRSRSAISQATAQILAVPSMTLFSWDIDDPVSLTKTPVSYSASTSSQKGGEHTSISSVGFLNKEGAEAASKTAEKGSAPETAVTASTGSVPAVIGPSPKKPEQIENVPMYRAYRGKTMTLVKANALLNNGCSFCTTKVTQYGKAFWFSNSAYVCQTCKEKEPLFYDFFKEAYEGILDYSHWVRKPIPEEATAPWEDDLVCRKGFC